MITWLLNYLFLPCLKFKYLSYIFLRGVLSLLTAFFTVLITGKFFIKWFKKNQCKQIIRDNGPSSHFNKSGTPTMGGIIIIFSITTSIIIWTSFNLYVLYFLIVLLSYSCIGFFDDYKKIINNNTKGISPLCKYFWQSIIALILSLFLHLFEKDNTTQIIIPFFKVIELGLFHLIFSYFVIVGTSNAVNLTDGLDGLAIVPIIFIAIGFAIIALVSSNKHLIQYLNVIYLKNAEELVIVCTSIIGAGLGFLWFNAYPAQIFMGDVGSLSLGGGLGIISVLTHQELLLLIMGGIFVLETVSVILQVFIFKLYKKRIFLMAPIHHHYELKGLSESIIIIRFWIISLILVFIALTTLIIK